MYSPIPHDLTTYNNQIDFEKYGFCSHQWEISVPQKNCIIWSVVLSYLKSADFSVPGKFEERLNRLVLQDPEIKIDPGLVKLAILSFNPFFNIHKCFFDKTLQDVSQSFKKLLKQKRHPKTIKTEVAQDMQLISTLLKSNILIVDYSKKKLHLVKPSGGNYPDVATTTIICREYWNKTGKIPVLMTRFTFSLNKDLCWELRIDAFRIILESTNVRDLVEKKIHQLDEKKEKKVNILITFLKENLTYVISELYDSSYIVAKLSGAGFETDPRVLDAFGFSSFYYALQLNDNNLVYILYRYAANNCYESVNTFRDRNPSTILNLSEIEKVLRKDCANSNNFEKFGKKAESARVIYQDLLRFNEFLTKVCRGINEIWEMKEDNSVKKAEKQKEIILIILETYAAFFSVGQLDLQHTSEEELIENYAKHKTYYDNLDLTVALLFFDNIFLLKSILKSPREGFYSDIESSFLLYAVTNKYFTGDARGGIKKHDLGLHSNSYKLSIIPILERINLKEEVKNFYNILRERKVIEEEIVKCIPPQEIAEMLSDFPKLKDEFSISRLEHYMQTALETESDGAKQKFVIERTLQVIVESLKVEEEDPLSIKHLLCKCLPDGTVEVLKKTRNTLSHLLSFQFPFKFETEKDHILVASMKSEIRKVRETFEKISDIQRVRLQEFLISRGLESVQKFQQNKNTHIHPLVKPMKSFGEKMQKRLTEFESLLDEKGTDGNCTVPNIDEFCRKLMGFASKDVKKQIRGEIPSEISTRVDAIQKLLNDLERGVALDLDRFNCLFLKKKDLRSIKKEYEEYLKSEAEQSGIFNTEENLKQNPMDNQKQNWNRKPIPTLYPRDEESAPGSRGSVKGQKQPEAVSGQSAEYTKLSLLQKIKKANPSNTLNLIFEKQKISDSQLKVLYEGISFSDEAKRTLNSLIETSKRPCGNNLANLLNRIEHLYKICINEQYDIRVLWEKGESAKAKQHLVYKIVQRYFRESSFQASLEMLLFDCVGILKKNEGEKEKRKSKKGSNKDQKRESRPKKENVNQKKEKTEHESKEEKTKSTEKENNEDQKKGKTEHQNKEEQKMKSNEKENNEDHKKEKTKKVNNENKEKRFEKNHGDQSFWLKDSYLFNGIDVRNVLAHGDPLFESIVNILDPKDLPSELVKKMLQLIEDRECIEALCDLWQKAKQLDQDSDKWCELKKSIVGCTRWREYSKLLAEDPKDSKTFDDVVTFLNETTVN